MVRDRNWTRHRIKIPFIFFFFSVRFEYLDISRLEFRNNTSQTRDFFSFPCLFSEKSFCLFCTSKRVYVHHLLSCTFLPRGRNAADKGRIEKRTSSVRAKVHFIPLIRKVYLVYHEFYTDWYFIFRQFHRCRRWTHVLFRVYLYIYSICTYVLYTRTLETGKSGERETERKNEDRGQWETIVAAHRRASVPLTIFFKRGLHRH